MGANLLRKERSWWPAAAAIGLEARGFGARASIRLREVSFLTSNGNTTVSPRGSMRRWLLLTLKLAIVALVVWFVHQTVVNAWNQLGEYPWEFHGGWLAAAAGLYIVGLLPAALFWFWGLRALGQHPYFGETLRAYFIGHLGKYVPGKAMVVVIRAAMIGGDRVDRGIAAASVFLESLTWIAVGSFLAAGYVVVNVARGHAVFWAAIGLMAVTGAPTLPPVFPRLARLAGVGKRNPEVVKDLHRLGYGTTILSWVLMTIGWALMGLAFWATLQAMGLHDAEGFAGLPRYTAAVALAIVAGFAFIFVPAGLGVREFALAEIMIPYLRGITPNAELAALAAAGLFRLVSVMSELMISGILYVVGLSKTKPTEEAPSSAQNR
jgi:glycosyltransferase 2 family protein